MGLEERIEDVWGAQTEVHSDICEEDLLLSISKIPRPRQVGIFPYVKNNMCLLVFYMAKYK